MATRPTANIVKSAICVTNANFRPRPSLFVFPGLSSRPFYDRTRFTWAQTLQDNVQTIKGEYLKLRQAKVQSDYAQDAEHKLHQGNWDWHSYILKGRVQESFREYCPETSRLLEEMGKQAYLMHGTPFSFSFFSTLYPGSQIAAHTGPCNLRIRCHLPLIVPSMTQKDKPQEGREYESMEAAKQLVPCGIRVGGDIRCWEEGVPLVFDDCYEHEVWNLTEEERVILLVDIWHPELSLEERAAIVDMFDYARQQGWMDKKSDQGA